MTEKELLHFAYEEWIADNIEHGIRLGKENELLIFKRVEYGKESN